MTEAPTEFDPLTHIAADESIIWSVMQSQVRSIVDSYHHRVDALGEALQNAVDAIEKRWADWVGPAEDDDTTEHDAVPRVRIVLDFDEPSIGVLDNGVGIRISELPDLLQPFISNKRSDRDPTRGHKGVGTSFLAYGHPRFEIHTKTVHMESPVAYAVDGGRAWAFAPEVTEPPKFTRLSECYAALQNQASGTFVKMFLDNSTPISSLNNIVHNTPTMWAWVLRSSTALGYVHLGQRWADCPPWVREIQPTLQHRDSTEAIPFDYPLPHTHPEPELPSYKSLSWLQRNPGTRREFHLLFTELNHAELKAKLRSELDELRDSEDSEHIALLDAFNKYEVAAYASLAYKNTFYEEQFRRAIGLPNARNFSLPYAVAGGVMMASVSMAMASLQPHLPAKMQPQNRRRFYLMVHVNDKFSPDIGRKTIPNELEPLTEWLTERLLALLRTQENRLERDRDRDTRPRGAGITAAQEELREFEQKIVALEQGDDMPELGAMVISRTPEYESEVSALFLPLVDRGTLAAYKLRALPGNSSRYDCLFDYELTEADALTPGESLPIGVHEDRVGGRGLRFTGRWLEFKVEFQELIANMALEDGAEGKKYFGQMDLAVVWSVDGCEDDNYEVEPFTRDNWRERQFLGSTHFCTVEGNDHRIEIIELRSFLRHWGEQVYGVVAHRRD